MKTSYLSMLAVAVFACTNVLAQPVFNEEQDPKPAGKTWERIDSMSDEFNGSALDAAKWDDQDPQWEGRRPTRFERSSVTVA